MMRRRPALLYQHPFELRTILSLGRFAVGFSLAFALLGVVHPLCAGQRRYQLSGNQIAQLQKQALSRRQLQTLNMAIQQYVADYEGYLPALGSPEKLRKQFKEYDLKASTLVCPFTNKEYLSNKNLAGKKLDSVAQPTNTLLVWSPKPMPDGHYLVLDASGRDRRISVLEFEKLKRSSGIK